MYAHTLVPIALDHENEVDRMFEIARRLGSEGGKITVLHVMEAIPGYVAAQMPEGLLEEARAATARRIEDIAGKAGGSAHWAVVGGSPGNAIVEYADEHGVDCIVLASHQPGVTDYFLGSTAARVVRHASCSVHVIR